MDHQVLSPETIQDVPQPEATKVAVEDIDTTFGSTSIDLLAAPLGTRVLAFSDEFFAPASALNQPSAPIHKPNTYTENGAWYDGWETRRHNSAPFDHVIFRLGVRSGRIKGVEIDTGFFSGNNAPEISVEGVFLDSEDADATVVNDKFQGWKPVLSKQECGPACRQAWLLSESAQAQTPAVTHVRLCMYPDGGIGRFRLYGSAVPVFPSDPNEVFDLAAMVNGGVATRCSDQHFGKKDNLLLPNRGKDMGDGWETKRSRGVHVDWVIIRLGAPGSIEKAVVDTIHFKGNFPKKIQLFAAQAAGTTKGDSTAALQEPDPDDHEAWHEILQPQLCGPHREHEYNEKVLSPEVKGKTWAFVKMVIIPDGGVKRLRIFGRRHV